MRVGLFTGQLPNRPGSVLSGSVFSRPVACAISVNSFQAFVSITYLFLYASELDEGRVWVCCDLNRKPEHLEAPHPSAITSVSPISISVEPQRSHAATRFTATSTCCGFLTSHSQTVATRHRHRHRAVRRARPCPEPDWPRTSLVRIPGVWMGRWYSGNEHGDARNSRAPGRPPDL